MSTYLKPVTAIYGVSPAVIALILHSNYRLAKLGMEDWLRAAIAAACALWTGELLGERAYRSTVDVIGGHTCSASQRDPLAVGYRINHDALAVEDGHAQRPG
jgi:hypothetical protein